MRPNPVSKAPLCPRYGRSTKGRRKSGIHWISVSATVCRFTYDVLRENGLRARLLLQHDPGRLDAYDARAEGEAEGSRRMDGRGHEVAGRGGHAFGARMLDRDPSGGIALEAPDLLQVLGFRPRE